MLRETPSKPFIDDIAKLMYNFVIFRFWEGAEMPTIRPSAYLRNNYNEISEFCHANLEPVFITKNGHGDLAVMSIEAYEKFCGRYELYHLLDEALESEDAGDFANYDDFMAGLRTEMA